MEPLVRGHDGRESAPTGCTTCSPVHRSAASSPGSHVRQRRHGRNPERLARAASGTTWAMECTIFQYIGELCRYLLRAPAVPQEYRIACAWPAAMVCARTSGPAFQQRFGIPRIFEFYASTEASFAVQHRRHPGRSDEFRLPCASFSDQAGQARPADRSAAARCAGYVHRSRPASLERPTAGCDGAADIPPGASRVIRAGDATEAKLLSDVAHAGDAWFRTGDLMPRMDTGTSTSSYRLGDTVSLEGETSLHPRWRQPYARSPALKDAATTGSPVPGADGRAGNGCDRGRMGEPTSGRCAST